MKKLYVPFLLSKDNSLDTDVGTNFYFADGLKGYYKVEQALEAAKALVLKAPNAKVVIMESYSVIEPRRIDFAEKRFNGSGELVV